MGKLDAVLAAPGGSKVFSELAVLAARCREYRVDAGPIRATLSRHRAALEVEVRGAPPTIQAVYLAYLPAAGLELPLTAADVRSRGILSPRPAEVDLGAADVYYLTHEISAACDHGLEPYTPRSPAERACLLRVLPSTRSSTPGSAIWKLSGSSWSVCGRRTRDTYAYRECLRVLPVRQSANGRFGSRDPQVLQQAVEASDFFHPTMNALTALLLERRSVRSGSP